MNCFAMTLWSVEKMYFLRNEVGSGWMGCISMSVQLPVPAPVGVLVFLVVGARAVRGGLLCPLLELLGREDGQRALHLVVVRAAVLRAGDVEFPRLLCLEQHPVDEAGRGVL